MGVDGAGEAVGAMDEGGGHAKPAQRLDQMGDQGIKAASAAARGEDGSARIDTGFFLATPMTSGTYKAMVGIE